MNSRERRDDILKRLYSKGNPVKGGDFASLYGVTRQVIVKDIAILRASGASIIATPDGYTILKQDNFYKDIVVTKHSSEDMRKEMEIIIKYGGIVEDVSITHSVYGEIKGMIMVRNLNELNKFIDRCKLDSIIPLSMLTNGVHMHTISAIDKESIDLIKSELKEQGFLI